VNSMLTVISGASPKGMREYGQAFLDSFAKHWPTSVRLLFYTEEPVAMPRGENRLIWDIPGCRDFIERHRENRAANGREPRIGWKDRDRQTGYSYRYDAWKFCRQGFIPLAAAQEIGDGLLCWLDGDVVTHRDVPEGFIESLLPAGKDVAYLGRGEKHSEIGFQLYRLPHALPLLERFRSWYASDGVFGLREWHSAFVWDLARRESGLRAHDLTPGGSGHVWMQSPLRQYTDHKKGDRKKLAHSPEFRA
jgi:hypothetical protein